MTIVEFAKRIFSNLLKAEFLVRDFEKFQDVYVLIDKGELIQTFTTFEDYLQSGYAGDM